MTKTCIKCGETKTTELFPNNKNSPDGKRHDCKECVKAYNNRYSQANKQKLAESHKAYREKNKIKIAEYAAAYYIANKEHLSKYLKQYQLMNINKLRLRKKEYWESVKYWVAPKNAEYSKQYRQTPQGRLKGQQHSFTRRALLGQTWDGTITIASKQVLLLQQANRCFHCKSLLEHGNTPTTIHLDHLIPLSKGGPNSIANVVWSCASCNLKKHATIIPQARDLANKLNIIIKEY